MPFPILARCRSTARKVHPAKGSFNPESRCGCLLFRGGRATVQGALLSARPHDRAVWSAVPGCDSFNSLNSSVGLSHNLGSKRHSGCQHQAEIESLSVLTSRLYKLSIALEPCDALLRYTATSIGSSGPNPCSLPSI